MPTDWFRSTFAIKSTDAFLQFNLGVFSSFQAIRRIHFGWSGNAVGNGYEDLFATVNEQIVAGIVTTIGDGTEVPPDPLFQPSNQNPPTERWLWWEARAMRIDAFPQVDSGAWSCSTVDPAEPSDSRAQLVVPPLPEGQFVRAWFVVQTDNNWPFQVGFYVTGWFSLLLDLGPT